MNLWDALLIQPLMNGLLLFMHLFWGNLGIAIIGLTLLVRAVLIPVTLPSQKAMQRMRDLAPEIEKLKKRHKDDKTALMQAQSDLYKANGVNPAAGCLPQIAQIVILIGLFNVFSRTLSGGELTDHVNQFAYDMVGKVSSIDTRFLFLDLTKPDVVHISGLPFPLPGMFLVAAALFQFISSQMMMPIVKKEEKAAKKTEGETDDIMVATQKQMLYLFPILTLFIGLNFASGLVLYWVIFSLSQTVQQYFTSGWGGLTPWLNRFNLVKSHGK